MRGESIRGYIWFGSVLRYLQDVQEGNPIHGERVVVGNLREFLGKLDELELVVTANAARNEGLPGLLEELEASAADARLTLEQATRLTGSVTAVRKTLSAEAAEKKAFVTAPKRWDVDKLLGDPGALFAAGVYARLSARAAFDFGEACKCLAFERSTATAFHLMRGTEAVLRDFYCQVVRQKRLAAERRMWGPMVRQMRARSKPPPAPLLDNLDSIRHNFRNPTQHPDEIYSVERAQDLLGLVVPVVNEMVALMEV